MGAKVTIQANVIRSNDGERTVIENIAAYNSAPALADLLGSDLICKDNLTEAIPTILTPETIDIEIGTNTPLVIDYTPYAAFGLNPILELQIFRTDDITAQVFIEIERDIAVSGTITIPFDGMPTLDHYQLVISQR